jgi:Arc/MetJ family transcription regulator
MNYTTVTVTKEYLDTVQRITGLTPGEAADLALQEMVLRAQQGLLELRGQIDWEGDLEDRRQGRTFDANPS